jgi:hypothetical protein
VTRRQPTPPWWLWFSVPIAVLAIGASLCGIYVDSVYAKETENFAAQGVGQDIANLVAYPILLLLAWTARHGSVRAYLGWLGVLVYSLYSFAIYAFGVTFNALFLVYVIVLGLSAYAFVIGLASIAPVRVKEAFSPKVDIRATWMVLVGVAVLFSVKWLSEDVPAILGGTAPQSLIDAGLPTNPVHVIDMALVLPAVFVTGVLLSKRHAWGFLLTPVLLTTLVLLAAGIACLLTVLQVREVVGGSWAIAAGSVVLGLLLLGVDLRFLRGFDRSVRLSDVLRSSASDSPDRRPDEADTRMVGV